MVQARHVCYIRRMWQLSIFGEEQESLMTEQQADRMTPGDWQKARSKLLALSLKAQATVATSRPDDSSATTNK